MPQALRVEFARALRRIAAFFRFESDDIASGFSEFPGYDMPRKVIASHATMKTAGTVVKKIARWLVEQCYTADDETSQDMVGEAARDLLASQKVLDELCDWLSETGPVQSGNRLGHRRCRCTDPRGLAADRGLERLPITTAPRSTRSRNGPPSPHRGAREPGVSP